MECNYWNDLIQVKLSVENAIVRHLKRLRKLLLKSNEEEELLTKCIITCKIH